MATTKPLLTFEQARERLNVAKSTLWLLLQTGRIRGARKVGAGRGAWRIDADGLEAFIHEQDQPAPPTARPIAPPVRAIDADADLELPPVAERRFA